MSRYEIDDTDQVRPHVRLCHLILRESLAAGFTTVELSTSPDAEPTARARIDGPWKPFMAFPPAVYSMLVEYIKQMAGVAATKKDGEGTILVRVGGRDAAISLRARRDERGGDELVLDFPTAQVGEAAP